MHKLLVLLPVALLASCVPPQIDLEGKRCDPAGACAEGFACVAGACLHLGAAGTSCSGSTGCDAALSCVNSVCTLVPDGGCSAGSTRACGSAVGACSPGVQVCLGDGGWTGCDGGVGPSTESCDGVDEDCDGVPDNAGEDGGYACALDSDGGSCTTSCGSTGLEICTNDCSGFACVAPAETCNGLDDDCIGGPDNGFRCVQGSRDGGTCTPSCGSGPGVLTCADDCSGYTDCRGPAETCNGVDDDCDGVPDNGFTCAMDSDGGACVSACGSAGRSVCKPDCSAYACVPPAETCNAVDDDCDGVADNVGEDGGFACVTGATDGGTCSLSCGATGFFVCKDDCSGYASSCTAPAERCNGLDDNCDGGVDEGLTQLPYVLSGMGSAPAPVLAASSEGGLMAYVDSSTGTGRVMLQRIDASLAPAGIPFAAHPSSAAQSSPQVVNTRNGQMVGWIEGSSIQLELIGPQAIGAPFPATTAGPASWSMASMPNAPEVVWVAWATAAGAFSGVKVVAGQPGASFSIAASQASAPSVAASDDGGVGVAYVFPPGIHAAFLFPDGGSQAKVTVIDGGGPLAPSAAWTSAGFLVAYELDGGVGSTLMVNGVSAGAGTQFDDAAAPHLASSPDGAALAFSSQRALPDGGTSWQLHLARLDPSGALAPGAEVGAATPLPGLQPFVAYTGTGYLAAWSGGGSDVYQQLICP